MSVRPLLVATAVALAGWPAVTISNPASQGSTTGGTNTQAITGVTASVGTLVLLQVVCKNSAAGGTSPITTITDAAGNTWTPIIDLVRSAGGVVDDGICLKVFRSTITSALAAATITVNFSVNVAARGTQLHIVTGGTPVVQTVGAGVTGTAAAHSTGNFSVDNGATVIGMAAEAQTTWVSLDSDTVNGTWSAGINGGAGQTGTGSTAASLATQWKRVSATGLQSWDLTKSIAPPYCIDYVIVHG